MNPLQFLYDEVDILKDGNNGKVSIVYDKVAKNFYVLKERDLKAAEVYRRLSNIKSLYLPEIYQTVEFGGKLFIVEEFIKGRTLLDYLTYNNGLDEKKSAQVLRQLCECLKILHAQKIIHRDIKPSNVMLTENENVKLIDFSISRIEKENKENDTDFLGTKGYAPPEQFGFGQTDARSDIYSLGVTIQKILGENYDGYLKKILAKCTEMDPKNRYQSVEEILSDIDKNFLRHKIKKVAVNVTATCATAFSIFTLAQNFFAEEEMPVRTETVEEIKPQKEKSKLEKFEPRETSKKVEWAEIKIPENISVSINPAHQSLEVRTSEDTAEPRDPRLNRICTLTLNGKTYEVGNGEISADIWKAWKNDGKNFYLPQNFSVNLNLENKDAAPLNISVTANLKGLQESEKVFPAVIPAGTSKNFEIPIGGLACINGKFEVEIWLRENDGAPLFGYWNGENFSSSSHVVIFLADYNNFKTNKKKFRLVS